MAEAETARRASIQALAQATAEQAEQQRLRELPSPRGVVEPEQKGGALSSLFNLLGWWPGRETPVVGPAVGKIADIGSPVYRPARTGVGMAFKGLGAGADILAEPLVSTAVQAQRLAPGRGGTTEQLRAIREAGISPGKLREAYQQTKLPFGAMTAIQTASDPLSVVGAGPAVRLAQRAGAVTTRAGGRIAAPARTGIVPSNAPSTKSLLRQGTDPSWSTSLAKRVDLAAERFRIKPARWAIRHIVPTAVRGEDDLIFRGMLERNRGLDWIDNQWTGMEARFNDLTDAALVIKKDLRGISFVENATPVPIQAMFGRGATRNPTLQDFFQKRASYIHTPAQTRMFRHLDEMQEFVTRSQRAEGVARKELVFPVGQMWFHRLATHAKNVKGEIEELGKQRVSAKVGATQSIDKARWHEYAEDGIAKGVRYSENPVAAMEIMWKAGMHSVFDARLVNAIRPLGRVLGSGKPEIREKLIAARAARDGANTLVNTAKDAKKVLGAGGSPSAFVSGPTTAKIRRTFPGIDIRDVLRNSDPAELSALYKDALLKQSQARRYAKQVALEHKEARRMRRGIRKGEAVINQPGFNGRVFPKEIADDVNRFYSAPEANSAVRALSTVAGASRTLGTTIDVGVHFLQLQSLLFFQPKVWGRTFFNVFETLLKGDNRAWGRALADPVHAAAQQRSALRGVTYDVTSEMVEQAGPTGVIGRVPLIGRAFQRFQKAWTVPMNLARLYTYEALETTAAKKGSQGLDELADFVNKLTGVTSQRHLSISARQQAYESMALFSPRYYKATIGLISDTLHGGLRGQLAREALAKFAFGGTMTYVAIAKMAGQEAYLDPRPASMGGDGAKFFTIGLPSSLGGYRVGPGGSMMSIFRALAHAGASLEQNPGGFITIDSRDQPFLKHLRGKLSPVSSAAWDVLQQKTFMGEPVDFFDSPFKTTYTVAGSRMLPFWLEGHIFNRRASSAQGEQTISSKIGARIGQTIPELFGMREFPTSPWEERRNLRDTLSEDQYGLPWSDINPDEHRKIQNENPDLERLTEAAKDQSITDELTELIFEQGDRVQDARDVYLDALGNAQAEFEATGNPRMFREKFDDTSKIYSGKVQSIKQDSKYTEVERHFAESREDQRLTQAAIAYDRYRAEVLANPDLHDEFGNYQYERRKEIEKDFKDIWGDKIYQAVRSFIDESRTEEPQLAKDLRMGRENPVMGVYWDAANFVAKEANIPELIPLYKDYLRATPEQQDDMEKADPRLKQMVRLVSQAKLRMRDNNKTLDAYLYRFGYTSTLRHPENKGREEMILNFG